MFCNNFQSLCDEPVTSEFFIMTNSLRRILHRVKFNSSRGGGGYSKIPHLLVLGFCSFSQLIPFLIMVYLATPVSLANLMVSVHWMSYCICQYGYRIVFVSLLSQIILSSIEEALSTLMWSKYCVKFKFLKCMLNSMRNETIYYKYLS